jgi:hypothetical protein
MKRAIVIGLNYTGEDYDLPDCEIDADVMAALLRGGAGAQVEVTKGECSPESIVSYLVNVAATQQKNGDTLYLYFSGHGTQFFDPLEPDSTGEAICLYDDRKGISILKDHDLRNALDKIQGTKIVILDSCFSGGMERAAMIGRAGYTRKFVTYNPDTMPVYRAPKTLKTDPKPPGKTYFLFASAENEYSYSTGDGGLFTKALKFGRTQNELKTISKLMKFARVFCAGSQTPTAKIFGGGSGNKVIL